jgi:hypothetical protein
MKKEYLVALIGGLFLLAYVLEAVIDPLTIKIGSPYDFLKPELLGQYPFTAAIIAMRALGIFFVPLLAFSFFKKAFIAKALTSMLLAGLLQLYALQNVVASAVVPLEWALAFALGGAALVLPTGLYFLRTFLDSMQSQIVKSFSPPSSGKAGESPKWLQDKPQT